MLPRNEPEDDLRVLAESVGMPVERMLEGVTRDGDGEILEIDWSSKDLKGTLLVGNMHMPYLRELNFSYNAEVKGEARDRYRFDVMRNGHKVP